jgi:hypothetical protein
VATGNQFVFHGSAAKLTGTKFERAPEEPSTPATIIWQQGCAPQGGLAVGEPHLTREPCLFQPLIKTLRSKRRLA